MVLKKREVYLDSEGEIVKNGFYKNQGEICYVRALEDGIFIIEDYCGWNSVLTKERAEKLGGAYSPGWLLEKINEDSDRIKRQKKNLDEVLKELSKKKKFIKSKIEKVILNSTGYKKD